MKHILPFLVFGLLLSNSWAEENHTLKLKGRVPASVNIVQDNKKTSYDIKSNLDKSKYTIKKIRKNDHQVIEITYH